jgi:hypothetical protein
MKLLILAPLMLVLAAATPPPAPKLLGCPSAGPVVGRNEIILQSGNSPKPMTVAGHGTGGGGGAGRSSAAMAVLGRDGDPHALGPKQDDPGPPPAPDLNACKK